MDVSQKPNHPDFRSCLHAGARGFSHQNRSRMDSGNLAGTAHHCYHRHCRHNRHLYLETQA